MIMYFLFEMKQDILQQQKNKQTKKWIDYKLVLYRSNLVANNSHIFSTSKENVRAAKFDSDGEVQFRSFVFVAELILCQRFPRLD